MHSHLWIREVLTCGTEPHLDLGVFLFYFFSYYMHVFSFSDIVVRILLYVCMCRHEKYYGVFVQTPDMYVSKFMLWIKLMPGFSSIFLVSGKNAWFVHEEYVKSYVIWVCMCSSNHICMHYAAQILAKISPSELRK